MDENHDCGGRPGEPHWRDLPVPTVIDDARRWNTLTRGLIDASAQYPTTNAVVEKFFALLGKAADNAALTVSDINNAMDEATK